MERDFIAKVVIRKKKAKEGFEYPYLLLPVEFSELIGREAEIYRVDCGFLIAIPQVANRVGNFESIPSENKNPQRSERKSSNPEKREFNDSLSRVSNPRKTWARPDSNRGPSPCQGDVITARLRALHCLSLLMTYEVCGCKARRSSTRVETLVTSVERRKA